jgi:hypothetical protein
MNRKTWIHTVLHLGCTTLLLLQGHRILQMQSQQATMQRALVQNETMLRSQAWQTGEDRDNYLELLSVMAKYDMSTCRMIRGPLGRGSEGSLAQQPGN